MRNHITTNEDILALTVLMQMLESQSHLESVLSDFAYVQLLVLRNRVQVPTSAR